MRKGEVTKNKLLHSAMQFSSTYGLNSVTIGKIAEVVNMSRTGVISHFENKEQMQVAILDASD